jgi:hypothetical protein
MKLASNPVSWSALIPRACRTVDTRSCDPIDLLPLSGKDPPGNVGWRRVETEAGIRQREANSRVDANDVLELRDSLGAEVPQPDPAPNNQPSLRVRIPRSDGAVRGSESRLRHQAELNKWTNSWRFGMSFAGCFSGRRRQAVPGSRFLSRSSPDVGELRDVTI